MFCTFGYLFPRLRVCAQLQNSTKLTGMDLRSTGIHRAILEISGIATRWPGRLCDDCDAIIKTWSIKFGKLEDLHPFLYGRGGCLEGIASGGELSKQVAWHFQSRDVAIRSLFSGSSKALGTRQSRKDFLKCISSTRKSRISCWLVRHLQSYTKEHS